MSHQIGLDVDIWFMPMPDHALSKEEREKISATNLVAADWKHVDPENWTPAARRLHPHRRRAARGRARAGQCRDQEGALPHARASSTTAGWSKVRPWYGHDDHIHVRLKCPADSPNCRKQPPVPGGDGCGDKELAFWFKDKVLHPEIKPSRKPPKPLTLADLPPACKTVLDAPAKPAVAAERK